ncbi:MAG TPA: GNAT family N-acetyltransferase [Dehalococcoidia bacterium]|nr:GNAT family N-acetyltransferase [Dehalococcoidia bacterium]
MTEHLTTHDEPLDRVSAEWSGLLQQCGEQVPFVTPAWQQVWLRHFQGEKNLRILTLRDGERLVAVAPLLCNESAEFVGHHSICDYMDAIITPGFERAVLTALLGRLASDGVTHLDLRGLREDSPLLPALLEAAASAGYTATKEEEALSPNVELPATWDDYLGTLSKKDRHEMRRKMRRLDSAGDIQMRIITTAEEAAPLLDTLFHLMRISNHHKEEFLDRPGMQEFFRDMTVTMADAGMLRLYALYLDDVPVAMVHNLDVGGTLYMYNSGYDPAYSHYAVGLMSKALLVRDAIESGRTRVDFMRGDESYKYDLGGKDRHVYRVLLEKA